MRWQIIVIDLGKSRHWQTWLECRFSWNENLQRRKNWTSKSTILKENAGKVVELKNAFGKLPIVVNLEAIRFEFWTERSISDGGNLCPLWSVILKSLWNNVGDTFKLRCGWPWAVVSCTLLAAVPWTGLEHSHRKARLCVYLTLKSDFFFSHP